MKNAKRNAVMLALADFAGDSELKIKQHLIQSYQATQDEVDRFKILIAYEYEDSYDGSSHFLLEEKKTGKLFEVHASHCSCYGYEGQFTPEATTAEYLLSDKCGRFYDGVERDWIHKNIRLTK